MTVKRMIFAAIGLYSLAVTPVASEQNSTAKTFAIRGVTELNYTNEESCGQTPWLQLEAPLAQTRAGNSCEIP
jgi:hypothetical protein